MSVPVPVPVPVPTRQVRPADMSLAFVGASRQSYADAVDKLEQASAGLAADELSREGDDLFGFAGLMHAEGSLRRAFSDASLPSAAKIGLADELLRARFSTPAMNIVHALITSRWSRPRDLVDATDTLGVIAALAAAEKEGHLDDVEDELFRFSRILQREPELLVALQDLTMPAEPREQLLTSVLEGKVRPVTLRLAREAVANPRGRSLDRALEDFVKLAAERRNRLIAEVWSAIPLSDEQEEQLRTALTRTYARDIQVQVTVDPELLGGVTVRVGDEVIDGSVRHRVEIARRRIAG
ncbi:MAG: F0F1 ATP synthase subunit delta [Actinomycetes bacterium]